MIKILGICFCTSLCECIFNVWNHNTHVKVIRNSIGGVQWHLSSDQVSIIIVFWEMYQYTLVGSTLTSSYT